MKGLATFGARHTGHSLAHSVDRSSSGENKKVELKKGLFEALKAKKIYEKVKRCEV